MTNSPSNWEHGSEFSVFNEEVRSGPSLPPGSNLYGSGRDALRALIQYGIAELDWRTLWVPSFFCQTVLRDIREDGIILRAYGDGPLDDVCTPIELSTESPAAVLTLNFFGLKGQLRPLEVDTRLFSVIEDHTHDPWSSLVRTSSADFCIASLRKTIPIPDGGILWSPVGHALPTQSMPTDIRNRVSATKLAGMVLKGLYLTGVADHKSLSRALMESGEEDIASGSISGMPFLTRTLLDGFDALTWRQRRSKNFDTFNAKLNHLSNLEILPRASRDAVPFSLVLTLPNSDFRNNLRSALIKSNVYPAILWSLEKTELEDIRPIDIAFSRRMLSLHCDGRYSEEHMVKLASIVADVVEGIQDGT